MPKVLLIDDDPHLRKIMSRVLNKYDYEVILAEDGATGLNFARQQRPDLIILDIIMPGMDGFEVAERLHHDPVCSRIPIMVLTAYATPYGRKMAVEIGVDDFVTKPFGIDDIVAKVKTMTSAPNMLVNERTAPLRTSSQARVICLHSLRGGLGCTSLAINLAASLKSLWMRPTLLLDADYTSGQVALALNWPDALSWSDLIQASLDNTIPRSLDDQRIAREGGLHVLSAPRDQRDADRINAKVVGHSLRLLEQSYDYIVADLAHDLRDNTLEVLRNADKILYVLSADAISLQLARQALAAYEARGIQPDDVLLVLANTRPGRMATLSTIELAVGKSVAAYIPYSPEMTGAIDHGMPFVEFRPRHMVTHLLQDLAYLLSKPVHRHADQSKPTELYNRVRSRAAAAASNGSLEDIGGYMLKQVGIER